MYGYGVILHGRIWGKTSGKILVCRAMVVSLNINFHDPSSPPKNHEAVILHVYPPQKAHQSPDFAAFVPEAKSSWRIPSEMLNFDSLPSLDKSGSFEIVPWIGELFNPMAKSVWKAQLRRDDKDIQRIKERVASLALYPTKIMDLLGTSALNEKNAALGLCGEMIGAIKGLQVSIETAFTDKREVVKELQLQVRQLQGTLSARVKKEDMGKSPSVMARGGAGNGARGGNRGGGTGRGARSTAPAGRGGRGGGRGGSKRLHEEIDAGDLPAAADGEEDKMDLDEEEEEEHEEPPLKKGRR